MSRERWYRHVARQINDDKWNWAILVLVGLAVLSWLFVFFTLDAESVGRFWDRTEPVTGFLTLLVIVVVWVANLLRLDELNTEVTIVLRSGEDDRSFVLPYRPLRSEISRAELQGIFSAYFGKERYPPRLIYPVIDSVGGEPSQLTRVVRGATDQLVVDLPGDFFDKIMNSMETRLDGESSGQEDPLRGDS